METNPRGGLYFIYLIDVPENLLHLIIVPLNKGQIKLSIHKIIIILFQNIG